MDLRSITRNGEPWFIARDVCKALDLIGYASAHTKNLDSEDVCTVSRDSNPRDLGLFGFRAPTATLVNESGLYDLILSSRKDNAKAFQKWVTGTVLPTIRKTGMYLTPKVAKEVVERPEVFLARALVLAHDTAANSQRWPSRYALRRTRADFLGASTPRL